MENPVVTTIDNPASKKPRKTRTPRSAVGSLSAMPGPGRRPRRASAQSKTIEDAAFAPRHLEKPVHPAAQAAKGVSHLMARGKDMVAGDAASIATTAAIVVGAALIEVELIPGLIIGAGAILLGKFFPEMGTYVRPAIKGAIRAGFFVSQKAREVLAETTEQMQDLMAEVLIEQAPPGTGKKAASAAKAEAGAHSGL
jgi:Protein of unknown function (DUF5132)